MKSGTDLINDAKSRISEISATEAMAAQGAGEITFLDVRDQQEVNLGKVPGAVHISRGTLETKIEGAIPREADVVVYCASGNRSALVADTMQQMGYTRVRSLAGGFRSWAEAGGDIDG
ncbi:MAG: Rhodanese-like protein [Gemmatimonadetes bacterium]|jgi:rhodanese-related sulfurtransferase|nr:Rhodanese-like protein [Gemmatimonadota bacterium]